MEAKDKGWPKGALKPETPEMYQHNEDPVPGLPGAYGLLLRESDRTESSAKLRDSKHIGPQGPGWRHS